MQTGEVLPYLLDNDWPYKDSGSDAAGDSPGINPIPNYVQSLTVTEKFKMYMFYMPHGAASIPVPMEMYAWNWSAEVAQNANAPGTFDFVGNPTPAKDASKIDGTAWNIYPTWTGVFKNKEFGSWLDSLAP